MTYIGLDAVRGVKSIDQVVGKIAEDYVVQPVNGFLNDGLYDKGKTVLKFVAVAAGTYVVGDLAGEVAKNGLHMYSGWGIPHAMGTIQQVITPGNSSLESAKVWEIFSGVYALTSYVIKPVADAIIRGK